MARKNVVEFDSRSFGGKSIGTFFAVDNPQRDSTTRYTHISSANKANPDYERKK